MKTPLCTALLSLFAISSFGQIVRPTHYLPDGRDIVCTNGQSRYTRALYGPYTGFRIETSDRPVFAVYQPKKECCNVRFIVHTQMGSIAADSADYCEARYQAGKRTYLLRDKRWRGGEVTLTALCDKTQPRGLWQFEARGFGGALSVEAVVCETAVQKFGRNGDIGWFAKPGAFEAAKDAKRVRRLTVALTPKAFFAVDGGDNVTIANEPQASLAQCFDKVEKARADLAATVTITTPDPYLNTIGGNMVMAADGAWDGETWLHGAVGWRMQLPGWRGAYAGDFLGMPDRQRSHFDAYAESQVTGVPVTLPHEQDSANNLARGVYRWGTPMYSNGYICRTPHNNHQFHHYDMNLVYIDELLWHMQFGADADYMRRMWPVLKRSLAWEKNTWDPDGDGLYDAYCCIWASDALQYNSGAVTHSSAYNYRANWLAARIAEIIGENPMPYRQEAERILGAINDRLWLKDKGVWAEFQDFMGLRRLHDNPALWTVYTAIDNFACSLFQAYRATRWVDANIPHIPFIYNGDRYTTLSTSSWMPYEWSINNVAMAEVMHTALAYYEAGRADEATRLLKGTVVDFMYAGSSPGNFGQLSTLDRNTGEGYRDFADVTGISSRAIVQGLFGITPHALDGKLYIRPGFPASWDSASIHTPYIDYTFHRKDGNDIYHIEQRFPQALKVIFLQNMGNGLVEEKEFTNQRVMDIAVHSVNIWPEEPATPTPSDGQAAEFTTACDSIVTDACHTVDIGKWMNASVTDVFKEQYLKPRSPYTTLSLPKQGIGDWCSTKRTFDVDDSFLRAAKGTVSVAGVPFATPAEGNNIVFTSLWDNFPDSVTIPLKGKASRVFLLMAGTTNPMQSRFDNGLVTIAYKDGTTKTVRLRNPDNWCPIEQDYDDDGLAFSLSKPRPYRLSLQTGTVSRTLANDMRIKNARSSDIPAKKQPMLAIPGGAAQMLGIETDATKPLSSITVKTTANDVVIGVLGVTLEKKK